MAKSGRFTGRPATHLTDPLANGRYVLMQGCDLTADEKREHLLAVHDAVAEEIGDVGTFDRMAVRMALDLYGRSLESKDLIAAARSLSEFIRAMGRLRLLDSLRAGNGMAPGRASSNALWKRPWQTGPTRKREAREQEVETPEEDAADAP